MILSNEEIRKVAAKNPHNSAIQNLAETALALAGAASLLASPYQPNDSTHLKPAND